MEASLSREEWLAGLVWQVGAGLASGDHQPADDLAAIGGPDLTVALVASSVAAMHSNGHLLDHIVEKMTRGRWMREGTDYPETAIAAISTYRMGRFPGPKWWDTLTIEVSLLERWADQALRSSSRVEVEELLRTRWLIEEQAIPALSEGLGEPGAGPLKEIEDSAAQSPRIARAFNLKESKEAMDQVVATRPAAFANHRQLNELSASIGFLSVLEELASALDDDPEEHEAKVELEGLSERIRTVVRGEIPHLTVLETSAFEPVPREERLLREAVEGTRRRIHLPSLSGGRAVTNGLPDRLQGETLPTDYLIDEVFSAGGRSGLLAWGPTAYMWLALEKHEVPPDGELLPLALAVPADEDIPFNLTLQVAADEANPLSMDYRLGHTDETRRWLAMLALSGRITIDVFEIDPVGRLELLLRSTQDVKDLVADLRPRIVKSIENSEPAPFLTGNELEGHVLAGFSLSENAKSELLLTISSDAEASDDDVARTRRELLDAHVNRAWTLYAHGDPTAPEARVEEAMRAYSEARSKIGRTRRRFGDDPVGAHRDLVADFARDRRAVVHYNFKSNHIQGFLTANGGESREWISGEQIDLNALVEAAKPWLEGGHGDVDELLAAGEPVAVELDDALGKIGVDEVVVIPWAVLNGMSFAAIPLAGSTFGDRYRVSYAPSLAMLRPLVDAGDSPKHEVQLISAHNGSLRWADAEVTTAKTFYENASLIPDGSPRDEVLEAMQRGRIVHLATHGEWWRDDPFASSLNLRAGGPYDSHISAAEIYRDVDVSGAELVTLSACDTGRSPSLRQGIETYSGLDAAFLAKGAKTVISTLWPIDDLAAMLFMTNLHSELSKGQALADAFDRSVGLLRSDELKALPVDHPVGTALDVAGVQWRDATARQANYFRTARVWAAFKLSGVPWLSNPYPLRLS